MDKRRKSTKEVDGDGDDDGVSLSIMKMAQQGEVEKSDRRRELSVCLHGRAVWIFFLMPPPEDRPPRRGAPKGHLRGPVPELGDDGRGEERGF